MTDAQRGGISYGWASYGGPIEVLQDAFNRCNPWNSGPSMLATDGSYGNHVRSTVRTFQSKNGLGADGSAGPATRKAMSWPTLEWSGAVSCARVSI